MPDARKAELIAAIAAERRATAAVLLRRRIASFLDVDLTLQQIKVVILVTLGLASTSKELAARLHVTAPTVSSLVDRLVEAGYLEREHSAVDRRSIILTPTADAWRVHDYIAGAREFADELMSQLDTKLLQGMLDASSALRRLVESQDEAGAAPGSS